MVTRKRTQTQDPHHPVLSGGFCNLVHCNATIGDEYSVVLLVFRAILMIYKNKKNAVSLLPVLRTSLPVTALMWRFCLAGNTYSSREYCSGSSTVTLSIIGCVRMSPAVHKVSSAAGIIGPLGTFMSCKTSKILH